MAIYGMNVYNPVLRRILILPFQVLYSHRHRGMHSDNQVAQIVLRVRPIPRLLTVTLWILPRGSIMRGARLCLSRLDSNCSDEGISE